MSDQLTAIKSVRAARKRALDNGLRGMALWVENRASGDHDPSTTLSILERKIADLRGQVIRAGRAAGGLDDESPFETIFPAAL